MAKKKIPEEDLVIAKCPKCRKDHKTNVFWTGNGKPWIYCYNCKLTLSTYLTSKQQKY